MATDLIELKARRDSVNALNEPLEAKLHAINLQIAALQAKALEVAARIDDNRGRGAWIELKREIARLSRG